MINEKKNSEFVETSLIYLLSAAVAAGAFVLVWLSRCCWDRAGRDFRMNSQELAALATASAAEVTMINLNPCTNAAAITVLNCSRVAESISDGISNPANFTRSS